MMMSRIRERGEQLRRTRGIVLAIRVDRDDGVRASRVRHSEAGAQCGALAAIGLEAHRAVATRRGHVVRRIGRAVIHGDQQRIRQRGTKSAHDTLERRRRIVRRNDAGDQPSRARRLSAQRDLITSTSSCSIEASVCTSSARLAFGLSCPFLRCSSTFCRAPSIVYFST